MNIDKAIPNSFGMITVLNCAGLFVGQIITMDDTGIEPVSSNLLYNPIVSASAFTYVMLPRIS